MGYSRSVRKQLIALDLVEGVVDAHREANPSNVKVDQALREIEKTAGRIKGSLVWTNRKGGPIFENKREYERYKKEVQRVQRAVIDSWPNETLDGREYVNAILIAIDDRFAGVSSKTQEFWVEMVAALQHLYYEMDPDLEAEATMDAGERAAQILMSTLEDL